MYPSLPYKPFLTLLVFLHQSLAYIPHREHVYYLPGTTLIIHFKAVVNGDTLKKGMTYHNSFDEPFTIDRFKFYIGKIRLSHPDGRNAPPQNPDDYFLIDFADTISTSVKIQIEPGKYNMIHFLMGVDSARNVSGAQTGALDPMKGMFWTWTSGYVMAKLEGTSSLSNQPAHIFEYHIGGYREPNNTIRDISLALPAGRDLVIEQGAVREINITADINTWFNGPHPIHIKEIPVCSTPGTLAKNISENYARMFGSIEIIK